MPAARPAKEGAPGASGPERHSWHGASGSCTAGFHGSAHGDRGGAPGPDRGDLWNCIRLGLTPVASRQSPAASLQPLVVRACRAIGNFRWQGGDCFLRWLLGIAGNVILKQRGLRASGRSPAS